MAPLRSFPFQHPPPARGVRTQRLRRKLSNEQGSAVVTAITLIVVGLTLATAAVVTATNVLRGSVRDEQSKDALAAADAGAQMAVYRYNQVATDNTLQCVIESLGGELVAASTEADGWCKDLGGQVGDATYSYESRPSFVTINVPGGTANIRRRLEIVSTGTSGSGFQDPVTRRIEVSAVAPTGESVFAGSGAIGVDDVHITGSSDVNGPASTNGDMTIDSSGTLCGDAEHGKGHKVTISGSGSQCTGYTQSESFLTLAPPNQGDAPTNNSNARIGVQDPFTGPPAQYNWNAVNRTLDMASNVTLTLGASTPPEPPYSLCKLTLSGNSSLIIGQTARVQIFFDTPENCGLAAGTPQLQMLGNSEIKSTSGDPTAAQLLFVGSDDTSSTIELSGNSAQNDFVIYAPRHDVTITGNGKYSGGIAGKTLTVDGSAEVNVDDDVLGLDLGVLIRYVRESYVECATATGTAPDDNC